VNLLESPSRARRSGAAHPSVSATGGGHRRAGPGRCDPLREVASVGTDTSNSGLTTHLRLLFADGPPTCTKSRNSHRPRSWVPLLPPVRPPGSRSPCRARSLVHRGRSCPRSWGSAARTWTVGCSSGPPRHLAGADASCRHDSRGSRRVAVPRGQRSCAVHHGARLALEPSASIAKVGRSLRTDPATRHRGRRAIGTSRRHWSAPCAG
jgi:hypothetical protein